jgi:hypothetical protein
MLLVDNIEPYEPDVEAEARRALESLEGVE